ncbi:hypothetical protein ACFSGX_09460 [Sphingomonas arantia]|uniref:Uncharacterized protein n=1 Tax=Sphingomonas arantia TaxID=1460676 RepID=A0ABW4TW96_9SPHN
MTGHLRYVLLSSLGALLLGALLGLSTVNGLRERTLPTAPIYPRSSYVQDPVLAAETPDCAGCTTYDEGYRWASAHAVDTADACFADDWAYQRGCMAYIDGRRPN